MKITDEPLLDVFRARPCEWCGAPPRSDPHHVYRKGMGGGARLDVCLNLISACRECHQKQEDGRISRSEQWERVAAREGLVSGDDAKEAVWRLLRRDKRCLT